MAGAAISIGVHVHAQPERLLATLASLRDHTPEIAQDLAQVVLLPDGPDAPTRATLAGLGLPQLGTDDARGGAASFNRLALASDAAIVVLLESGALVGPGWLGSLLAGIGADPARGLAGPSTNRSWNEQGAFPRGGGTAASIADTAREAERRFGAAVRPLAPLHSLADFCYLVRRDVITAIGGADEGYGLGPCWEMDYNIRAARAGFTGLWVGAAYVYRSPATPRRRSNETRLFDAGRRRYQDKFCGHRLRGDRAGYEPHCIGEDCAEFAPRALVSLRHALAPAAVAAAASATANAPGQPVVAAPAVATLASSSARPAVTCIMPTYDRRGFVPQAIRYFLRQEFTDAELLIVDDGSDPVASLVPAHPRIRYLRIAARRSIGAKRNLACGAARGEFIAHWDDDDWYPPGRLGRQLAALKQHGCAADLCGTSHELFYEPATDGAWLYKPGAGADPFLNGASLFYRRALWERAPFADVQIGEDVRFVRATGAGARLDLVDPALAVGIIHRGNTSPKRTGASSYWTPHPSGSIHGILGEDLAFYRGGRVGGDSSVVAEVAAAVEVAEQPAPLVSCIMPTRDRREFVAQSLSRFAEQDYPSRELIVVDDGTDPVEDLVAGVAGVRYLRLARRASIGAKRNLACAEARGAIIVHWDDDDWYGPTRLSLQVAPILAGEADLTGFENRFVLDLNAARFWTVQPALHRRMFVGDVHGGTLAYRRGLFDAGIRYPAVSLAEDAAFLRAALAAGMRLARLANAGVFIYVRHGENAWPFHAGTFLDSNGWAAIDPPASFSRETWTAYQEIARRRARERPRRS